jgi:hypothetical protein
MSSAKRLEEAQEFNAEDVITELHMTNTEEIYFYFNDEPMGSGRYIDFSEFNPFEKLGFRQQRIDAETDELGWVSLAEQLPDFSEIPLSEVIDALEEWDSVTVRYSEKD